MPTWSRTYVEHNRQFLYMRFTNIKAKYALIWQLFCPGIPLPIMHALTQKLPVIKGNSSIIPKHLWYLSFISILILCHNNMYLYILLMLMQILFFRCQTTSNMTLGFIYIKYLSGLFCQNRINLHQTICHVLMFGRH